MTRNESENGLRPRLSNKQHRQHTYLCLNIAQQVVVLNKVSFFLVPPGYLGYIILCEHENKAVSYEPDNVAAYDPSLFVAGHVPLDFPIGGTRIGIGSRID